MAEVLITLTIIGVIAAITIPNLMQSWRRHERITQVKTAYSIIQNAIKISIAENGPSEDWKASDSCDFGNKYIFPYLKIQYICGKNGKFFRNGCFIDNNKGGTWHWMNGNLSENENYGTNDFCKTKLSNGMDFGVAYSNFTQNAEYKDSWPGLHRFVFDVNGAQGTTTAGNDIFLFSLKPQTGKVTALPPWGCQASRELSCILTDTGISATCRASDTNTKSGQTCARVLELNHWEFPDNYPIKKF